MDRRTYRIILLAVNLLVCVLNLIRFQKADSYDDAKGSIAWAICSGFAANLAATLVLIGE